MDLMSGFWAFSAMVVVLICWVKDNTYLDCGRPEVIYIDVP